MNIFIEITYDSFFRLNLLIMLSKFE